MEVIVSGPEPTFGARWVRRAPRRRGGESRLNAVKEGGARPTFVARWVRSRPSAKSVRQEPKGSVDTYP